MPPKARSVLAIENFSLQTIGQHGAEAYAEVGNAVLSLAQSVKLRERHAVAYARDIETKKPFAGWVRDMPDGMHSIAVSRWHEASFFMHDVRLATESNSGFLRMYLFGNDSMVSGLSKAYRILRVNGLEDLPKRSEIDAMIDSYHGHPSKNRLIQSREGIGTFTRLIKSILKPHVDVTAS